MTWSEGHVWTLEVDLPVDQEIEYKYVILNENGEAVQWENGANRKVGQNNQI